MQNKLVTIIIILPEIHMMITPIHAIPQNCCYFASASVWEKAIKILHTLCK